MASPQVTVRLDPETYKTLVKLAQMERKNLAELTRELIEQGIGRHQSIETEVLDRLNQMSAEMGELLARAVKASGHAAAYALMSTRYTYETQHYTVTDGQTLDDESKKERQRGWEKYAKEIAEKFLSGPFEKL
jgi:predicted DNA-binding protein